MSSLASSQAKSVPTSFLAEPAVKRRRLTGLISSLRFVALNGVIAIRLNSGIRERRGNGATPRLGTFVYLEKQAFPRAAGPLAVTFSLYIE